MHRVTAAEKHRVGHSRAIVMRTRRFAVLPRVDIRFHDVAEIVHVIAEYCRNVVLVFRDDCVMARRRGEARFAGRDRRFTDEMFAFVEIGVLVRDADDDLRRAGHAVAIPIAGRRRRRHGGCRSGRDLSATREQPHGADRENGSENSGVGHKDAQSNASGSLFNSKDLGPAVRTDGARRTVG
jgi:hypothetical protein